jgi:hypothetical protein
MAGRWMSHISDWGCQLAPCMSDLRRGILRYHDALGVAWMSSLGFVGPAREAPMLYYHLSPLTILAHFIPIVFIQIFERIRQYSSDVSEPHESLPALM